MPPRDARKQPRSEHWSLQSPAAPVGGLWKRSARQSESALRSPEIPFVQAPLLRNSHIPGRASGVLAYCHAPRRQRSLRRHRRAASTALEVPARRLVRARFGLRRLPPPHRWNRHSQAAKVQPHRPRAAPCPLPRILDSRISPAKESLTRNAEPFASNKQAPRAPAPRREVRCFPPNLQLTLSKCQTKGR